MFNIDLLKIEVDENFILCYKDGFLLFFFDFIIIICVMIGCYVIFYNEWFDK